MVFDNNTIMVVACAIDWQSADAINVTIIKNLYTVIFVYAKTYL